LQLLENTDDYFSWNDLRRYLARKEFLIPVKILYTLEKEGPGRAADLKTGPSPCLL
jgi:hypothetical protein